MKTAKQIALKIEKDFQKFFKVKHEFKNAVEKAMTEFAKAACKEQRKNCSNNCVGIWTESELVDRMLKAPLPELK